MKLAKLAFVTLTVTSTKAEFKIIRYNTYKPLIASTLVYVAIETGVLIYRCDDL